MGPNGTSRFRKLLRAVVVLLAALGLLMLVVTFSPLDSWWAGKLAGAWYPPKGDVLIVLSGSNLDKETIGLNSYWRCVYAIRSYHEGGFREVIVSGAESGPAMSRFLAAEGIPPERIRIEGRSNDTRQNALYTKALLEGAPGRKVLLTSDYHMFRAYRVFTKAGLAVTPVPFPDVRKRAVSLAGRWPAFLDLVFETVKIGYYFVRGWM